MRKWQSNLPEPRSNSALISLATCLVFLLVPPLFVVLVGGGPRGGSELSADKALTTDFPLKINQRINSGLLLHDYFKTDEFVYASAI